MLKALLAVVVAANLLFFGFTRGWFDGVFGLDSRGDREPDRVARQVRAAAIVLMPMASTASSSSSASASACWEAGPVTVADAAAAETALKAALPAGAWVDVRGEGSSATATHTYRVANADAALVAKLTSLRLGSGARPFSACSREETPTR